MSAFDVEYTFQSGYNAALKDRRGKGWSEVVSGSGVFQFYFVCNNCSGALPGGFIIAPRYCPYCGKDHEYDARERVE